MDPPTATLINEAPFPNNANANANANANYNLSQICHFPIHGGTSLDESGAGLALRMAQFAHHLGQFGEIASLANRELVVPHAHGASKKRPDADQDSTANANANSHATNDSAGKRLKTAPCKDDNHESKTEAEPRSGQPPPELTKQDYIHVRARRGQATDSHSLAERARREKISERMKVLQDLVPGCNKVIGKALVLDEIINYIQSLQHQVEFLSMKLEAVNTRVSPGIEVFPPKDYGQQAFDTTGVAFGSQASREYSRGSSPEWLHMQIGGGFERTT